MSADEVVIDVDLARRLLRNQFPEWAELPITEIASGWDNTTYLLGDESRLAESRVDEIVADFRRSGS